MSIISSHDSPSMAVGSGAGGVRQARMTEFFGQWRCHACLEKDSTCYIQPDQRGCILCLDRDQHCRFTRIVERTSDRSEFSWEELQGGYDDVAFEPTDKSQNSPWLLPRILQPDGTSTCNLMNSSTGLNREVSPLRQQIFPEDWRRDNWKPQQLTTPIFVDQQNIINSPPLIKPNGPSNALPHRRRSEQDPESRQFVLETFRDDGNRSPKPARKGRKIRSLTDSEKRERAAKRKFGVCAECRKKKIRVTCSILHFFA